MNPIVKAATVLAVGIVVATLVWVYMSPYQQCVRALKQDVRPRTAPAEEICLRSLGGVRL
jgi:hypothetical protein